MDPLGRRVADLEGLNAPKRAESELTSYRTFAPKGLDLLNLLTWWLRMQDKVKVVLEVAPRC